MLDTTCPMCSAPYGRKLSVVYQEGLTATNALNNSISQTNTILKTKITTHGYSNGLNQTELSKSVAPPLFIDPGVASKSEKITFVCSIFALIVGMAIGFLFGENFITKLFFMLVFGLISGIIIACFMDSKPTLQEIAEYDTKMEPMIKARDEWNALYMCMSCTHRFIPKITSDN